MGGGFDNHPGDRLLLLAIWFDAARVLATAAGAGAGTGADS
jgi:hypothetical protein